MTRVTTTIVVVALACAGGIRLQAQDETEWFPLGGNGGRSLVYRSIPLATRNAAITRALIVIPAGGRGTAAQFAMAVDIARGAGLLQSTLIVTPSGPTVSRTASATPHGSRNRNCGSSWPPGPSPTCSANATR